MNILNNYYFVKDKYNYLYDENKKNIYIDNVTTSNTYKRKFNNMNNIIKYDKIFLFTNKYDYNWRHFINETFCSLRYILNNKNYKIVIPENEYNSNNFKHKKEIIEILNLQHRVVLLKENNMINANQMIICNKHLDFPFIKMFIKKCISLSNYDLNNKNNKLFLSRKNADLEQPNKRPITNISDFHKNFIKNNDNIFTIIPENLKLIDQIKIINNAKEIISFIGAGCDNIIFTNELCKFHILYPDQRKIRIWADCYRKKYYKSEKKCKLYIIGSVDYNIEKKGSDPYNWPWIIDLDKIKKIDIF